MCDSVCVSVTGALTGCACKCLPLLKCLHKGVCVFVKEQIFFNCVCVCMCVCVQVCVIRALSDVPAVELDAVGELGELVREPTLLDHALGADGHLAQRIGVRRGQQAELVDHVRHDIFGRGVLADDDVAALLVSLEHADHLVWNVCRRGERSGGEGWTDGVYWKSKTTMITSRQKKAVAKSMLQRLNEENE